MDSYSVLFVDDDKDLCKTAAAYFAEPVVVEVLVEESDPGSRTKVKSIREETVRVKLKYAHTLPEAEKLLRDNYFHLAIVDPRLKDNDNELEGCIFLTKLRERRPSCLRVLHTNFDGDSNMETILGKLHPLDGEADHFIPKTGGGYIPVIEQLAARWLARPIAVGGIGPIIDMLQRQVIDRERTHRGQPVTAVTADEIDYLISSLFGQGRAGSLVQDQHDIARVVLTTFIAQGHSQAVVVKATSYTRKGHEGIVCILKFARREYVQRELEKYSQYVRFRLDVQNRVELLARHQADTVAGLCYNFASDTSLTSQFLRATDDPGPFCNTLNELFKSKKWYGESHPVNLMRYFTSKPLLLKLDRINHAIRQFAHELQDRLNELPVDTCVLDLSPGTVATSLRQACTNPKIGTFGAGCVVHGDLHCDNVLVEKSGIPIFIDYATVNPGPRLIDFAALEASVRFLSYQQFQDDKIVDDPRPDAEQVADILRDGVLEGEVVRAAWEGHDVPQSRFWVTASITIAGHAKANWQDKDNPDGLKLLHVEYALTCLLWAFYLFRTLSIQRKELRPPDKPKNKDADLLAQAMADYEQAQSECERRRQKYFRQQVRLLVWILALARQLTDAPPVAPAKGSRA